MVYVVVVFKLSISHYICSVHSMPRNLTHVTETGIEVTRRKERCSNVNQCFTKLHIQVRRGIPNKLMQRIAFFTSSGYCNTSGDEARAAC